MKEIGEKLREARESIGVSLEEVATDLKLTEKQLKNIEEGNMEAFKDVSNLKYLIRDYSKYLGLNKEDMVDEFNEYLFDYTSKISLEDINNAKKGAVKEEKEEKIQSPYTIIKEKNKCNFTVLACASIVILGIIIVSIYYIDVNRKKDTNVIGYADSSYIKR